MPLQQKSFNIPYLQHENYWLNLFSVPETSAGDFASELKNIGYGKKQDGHWQVKTSGNWTDIWNKTYEALQKAGLANNIEVSVSPDADLPHAESFDRKKPVAIQTIAENLWLGEALRDDRVMCYFQPIIGENKKIFGYESFVRARSLDGSVISGGKIVTAGKALNIEHMIDRYLHVQTVKTFAGSDFSGFLFINFFPGFIHRPAVYLEGLTEAAKIYGIIPKNLVLELTRCENPHDIKHLKNIGEYAREQGYSIALDDITTVESAKKLIFEIRPDFVKIDSQALGINKGLFNANAISEINELTHAAGGTVIAEGVETEEAYHKLKLSGVDLFQGYYFSAPAPIEQKS